MSGLAPTASEPTAAPIAFVAFDGFYRPNADITDGTWIADPSGDLFAAIDEAAADDNDFIYTAIAGSQAATLGIASIPAGPNTLSVRASATAATTLRVSLLDAGGATVGTVTQALSSTITTYALNVTTTATATRVKLELITGV